MDNTFAFRLKKARNRVNLTQEQLSYLTGISLKSIQRYEQGAKNNREPSAFNLLSLSQVLDITPEELLIGGENHMNTYSNCIKNELSQISSFEVLSDIKKQEFNSVILSHLELSDDLISYVRNSWNEKNLFDKEDETHICYSTYVKDIVIKYCQNRIAFKEKYDLKDGMSSQIKK